MLVALVKRCFFFRRDFGGFAAATRSLRAVNDMGKKGYRDRGVTLRSLSDPTGGFPLPARFLVFP